jgi:predicted ATP-grasp superfamily ATP-dependent carboligase
MDLVSFVWPRRGFFMPAPSTPNLLIIGASTRAAAFSAARAGLRPRCLDQYADADLAALCPSMRFDPSSDGDRPRAIEGLVDGSPWLYTGPFENHPGLIEGLEKTGRLWGNGAETVRAVRDPWVLASTLARHGLEVPGPALLSNGPPPRGRWLVKPLASAGGRSIVRADEADVRIDSALYYQEFVEGPSFSALYVGAGGHARLLGVVRQFPGIPGAPFLYRGGVGPWPVPAAAIGRLRKLGEVLAAEFALVGLFGVDFILNDERPWPVEVNPRYTASVELLELATGRALLHDHVEACSDGRLGDDSDLAASRIVGKRILYASRRIVTPPIAVPARSADDPFAVPSIADVPWPGTVIKALEPLLTVFAAAETAKLCASRLDQLESDWMCRLEAAEEIA